MSWKETRVKLPPSVNAIHQAAAGAMSDDLSGIDALQSLQEKINWPSSSQAGAAAGMEQLRQQLDAMNAKGWMLTVHAWQHTVGKAESSGCYLSPKNAVKRLAEKLTDGADLRRPTESMQATVLMVCAGDLGQFVEKLKAVTDALPLPGLLQAYRLAASTAGLERSKMEQGGVMLNPYWPEQGEIVQQPQRDIRRVLLAELAQAGAAAMSSPTARLRQLAEVRAALLAEQKARWEKLQGMTGAVWVKHADGVPQNIAATLSAGVPGEEFVHTAAVLFLGNNLAFLREMLP